MRTTKPAVPKDSEFLLELPPHVQHFDVIVDEWSVAGERGTGDRRRD